MDCQGSEVTGDERVHGLTCQVAVCRVGFGEVAAGREGGPGPGDFLQGLADPGGPWETLRDPVRP